MNPDQFKDNKFPHSPPTLESMQNALQFPMNNSGLPLNNPNFLNNNNGVNNKPQNYMGIICDFDKVFNSRVFARKSAT